MPGHKGRTSSAKWARSQPDLVQAIGWTHEKSPCSIMIHNVLKKSELDVLDLQKFKIWRKNKKCIVLWVCNTKLTEFSFVLTVGAVS